MNQDRISGVLLHVTSFPSLGGVGDFGPAAYAFVDFLAAAKQRLWQVLPLNPTGYGSSPYSALSAFAGNPLLISIEHLAQDGWIAADFAIRRPDRVERLVLLCPGGIGKEKMPKLNTFQMRDMRFMGMQTPSTSFFEQFESRLVKTGAPERTGSRPSPSLTAVRPQK